MEAAIRYDEPSVTDPAQPTPPPAQPAAKRLQLPALDVLFAGLSGEHMAKLSLQGGVTAKIGKVWIFVAVAGAVVAWSGVLGVPGWVVVAVIAIKYASALLFTRMAFKFTIANPHASLMEGAELLVYEKEKLRIATKTGGVKAVVPANLTVSPTGASPALLLPASELDKPDDPLGASDPIPPLPVKEPTKSPANVPEKGA